MKTIKGFYVSTFNGVYEHPHKFASLDKAEQFFNDFAPYDDYPRIKSIKLYVTETKGLSCVKFEVLGRKNFE